MGIARVQVLHEYVAVSGTGYAFTSNNTAGNFLVVSVVGADNITPSPSIAVSDSQGNTYTALTLAIYGVLNGSLTQMFYAPNIKGGANSVKATVAGVGDLGFTAVEYSGIKVSSPLDTQPSAVISATEMSPVSSRR